MGHLNGIRETKNLIRPEGRGVEYFIRPEERGVELCEPDLKKKKRTPPSRIFRTSRTFALPTKSLLLSPVLRDG